MILNDPLKDKGKKIGRMAEYYIAYILSEVSDTVTIVPHNSVADIIFEYENKLIKCQVKALAHKRPVISRHTGRRYRSNYKLDLRRGSGTKDRLYNSSQIDIFGIYIHPLNKAIFLPFLENRKNYSWSDNFIKKTDTLESLEDSVQQILNKK